MLADIAPGEAGTVRRSDRTGPSTRIGVADRCPVDDDATRGDDRSGSCEGRQVRRSPGVVAGHLTEDHRRQPEGQRQHRSGQSEDEDRARTLLPSAHPRPAPVGHGSTHAVAVAASPMSPPDNQDPGTEPATVTSTHGGSRRTVTAAPAPAIR